MKSIQEYIEHSIKIIDNDIEELEKQKDLLQSYDLTQHMNEDLWHELCLTPLRASDLLGVIVKNMFPAAEDITVHANYVYFTLYGFKVQIPTSLQDGINVDTSWYKLNDAPAIHIFSHESRIDAYFHAKDTEASWKDLADIQYQEWPKIWRRLIWLFKKKDRFNEEDRKEAEDYKRLKKERLEEYYAKRKEMKEKTLLMRDKLLPELNKFSTKHFKYNNQYQLDVEEIIKYELETNNNA